MSLHQRRWSVLACSVGLAALLSAVVPGMFWGRDVRADPGTQVRAGEDSAVERTRGQVKMLDDLYKNAVVSITKRYIGVQDKQPAIMVAQDVFGAMRKQGWHSAKLVDATGEPLNDANAPQTDFEKEAAREINSGKPYFDRVVGEGKDRHLLAATVVPGRDAEMCRLPHPQEGRRGAGLHPVRHPHQVIFLPDQPWGVRWELQSLFPLHPPDRSHGPGPGGQPRMKGHTNAADAEGMVSFVNLDGFCTSWGSAFEALCFKMLAGL